MGTINYTTSKYVTLGIKPVYQWDLENDLEFMEEIREYAEMYGGTVEEALNDYISDWYRDEAANAESILSRYSFEHYQVTIEPGYYEGFSLLIENTAAVYEDWEDKRKAQKEITQLKKCLLELAGLGLVACYPGWRTGYDDYNSTCEAIRSAINFMREEARITPTWWQWERKPA